MKLRMLQRCKILLLGTALTLLLQACSSSQYSYRVRPAENYHEECGYAFACDLSGKPYDIYGSTITITIGVADNSKANGIKQAYGDSCRSVANVDSVSLGLAETGQTFKRLKSIVRFEYQFAGPSPQEGFKQRKKLLLKIYFKGEKSPKIFFLKFHEEQFQSSGRWISGC